MTTPKEHLVEWLRDAYAMEKQALEMLEKMANRIEHYPELRDKIKVHIHQSENQAERLETCLQRLGEDTSAIKTGLGKLVGAAQALSGMLTTDEIVKGAVSGYVFEHYEIANYKVLIAAAEAADEPEIARVCYEILREEEEMAQWLDEHMPSIINAFLRRDLAGQKAKV